MKALPALVRLSDGDEFHRHGSIEKEIVAEIYTPHTATSGDGQGGIRQASGGSTPTLDLKRGDNTHTPAGWPNARHPPAPLDVATGNVVQHGTRCEQESCRIPEFANGWVIEPAKATDRRANSPRDACSREWTVHQAPRHPISGVHAAFDSESQTDAGTVDANASRGDHGEDSRQDGSGLKRFPLG
jgi:hypothetical protein